MQRSKIQLCEHNVFPIIIFVSKIGMAAEWVDAQLKCIHCDRLFCNQAPPILLVLARCVEALVKSKTQNIQMYKYETNKLSAKVRIFPAIHENTI